MRKLCGDGLPTTNYFSLCSVYLLEYEKILKESEIRNKPLRDLVMESHLKNEKKLEDSFKKIEKVSSSLQENNYISPTETMEKSLEKVNAEIVIPKNKVIFINFRWF